MQRPQWNLGPRLHGAGPQKAKVFILGDSPTSREIEKGYGFAGRHGDLLNFFLQDIGLTRELVYITHAVPYALPGDRHPRRDEIKEHNEDLLEELRSVIPPIIIALGQEALTALHYDNKEKLANVRGQWRTYTIYLKRKRGMESPIYNPRAELFPILNSWVMPTWHPKALLHHPSRKWEAVHDWNLVKQRLQELGTQEQKAQRLPREFE